MARKEKKYHYIYKTTNLINEKYYIGLHSTDNLNDGYLGSGKRLWYSIKKYGKENFKIEILELLPDRSSLKEREFEIVNETLLIDDLCLNLKIGGGGGWGYRNEETTKKLKNLLRLYSIKNWEDSEFRKKMFDCHSKTMTQNHKNGKIKYDTFTDRKHKDESKKKIGISNSIKQKGELNSQYGTCWITNGIENKKIKLNESIPQNWYKGRK